MALPALAKIGTKKVYQDFQPRDWAEVAADFVSMHTDLLKQKLG